VHQGLFKDKRIELVEGTIYRFTAIETGRPVSGIAPDGTKVNLDRGRIRYTFLVDTRAIPTRATTSSSPKWSLTWLGLILCSLETPASATRWTRFAEPRAKPSAPNGRADPARSTFSALDLPTRRNLASPTP
jgi:hypothetical protein